MSVRLGFVTPLRAVFLIGAALSCAAQLLAGCGQTVEVGIDDALTSGASSGAGGAAPVAGSASAGADQAGAPGCVPTDCRGKPYECGDCLDNDADGVSDASDGDCLGPCDNDENGLSSGMTPSMSATCKQDCYFDGDSGPGNDQCEWNHSCDVLSVAPDYPPSGEMRCEYGSAASLGVDCEALGTLQQPACLENCLPLVPNGCDCFGCCLLPDGEFHFIGRGRGELGCQLDALDDAVACPRCSYVESCFNPCEECEVCVGTELKAGCSPESACPPGQAACTSDDAPCDYQEYCVTGCCVRAPEPI